MEEKKNKKSKLNFFIGIIVGIILYKLIIDVLLPMVN